MDRLYNGVIRVDAPCPANVLRIDQGAMPLVMEMHRNGILVSPDRFTSLDRYLAEKEAANLIEIESLIGHPCNPNSGDQVAQLLFRDLGLESPLGPKMTRKRTRPAADDDILASLLAAHPVVPLIRAGRELTKLRGTYTLKLPLMAWPDGRIRTTLRMNVARTGRLASEDPNLQNVPIGTEDGRRIRGCFVAPPGRVLGAIDLSQIEMVWAAELSGDHTMREVFELRQDLHVRTAIALFQLDPDRINRLWKSYKAGELTGTNLEEMRSFEMNNRLPAKHLGFAVLFGITPAGLQSQILSAGGPLVTIEECAQYILGWFRIFDGVRLWMGLQHSRVQRYGMVWTAFGRHRLVGEAMSAVPRVRSAGLRQAGATPIQGSAGDHLKIGMAMIMDLVHYYRAIGPTIICLPLLQIHDELVFELTPDIAPDFLEDCRVVLTTCVRPMTMPVRAAVAIGDDWGELK
jgi:DNA polymerase-1